MLEIPSQDFIDQLYLAALDVEAEELERQHRQAIALLRSGPVHVTTPEGTDISFEVGDRPFCSQIGDATRERMQSARTRIDRDIELPAGVLRVAPIEESVKWLRVLAGVASGMTEGSNLILRFARGHVAVQGVNADKIDQELTAAGGRCTDVS